MNPAAIKLMLKFNLGLKDATALVEAGFTNPRKIYNATGEQLIAVKGIDASKLAKLHDKKARGKK
jgi:hypothetical protein